MIEAFEGLDRHIPRPVRAELIGWQQQEAITISRVTLSDAPDDTDLLATPDMRWAFAGGTKTARCAARPWRVWS
ncbi:hypothetical protein ACWD1Z_37600 [Streptomyces sp. NPDC002784]